MTQSDEIILQAKALASKFVYKVETGRAHSVETYAECKALLELIDQKPINVKSPSVQLLKSLGTVEPIIPLRDDLSIETLSFINGAIRKYGQNITDDSYLRSLVGYIFELLNNKP